MQVRSKPHLHIVWNSKFQKVVVRRWPRVWNSDKTAKQLLNIGQFKQVVAWSKNPLAEDYQNCLTWSKGTTLLPRDIYEKQCYGLLIRAYVQGGGVIYGAREVNEQIQTLLDAISSTPGSILVRNAAQWVALDAGPQNDVLTSNGPNLQPTWAPVPSGPQQPGGITALLNTANNGSDDNGYCGMGNSFHAQQNLTIFAISFLVGANTNYSYNACICKLNIGFASATITDVIQAPQLLTATQANNTWVTWILDTPYTVLAQEYFGAMIIRNDGSGTTSCHAQKQSSGLANIGLPVFPQYSIRSKSLTPAIGDSLDTGGGQPPVYTMTMLYQAS